MPGNDGFNNEKRSVARRLRPAAILTELIMSALLLRRRMLAGSAA